MEIRTNCNTQCKQNFKAKFLYSDDLKSIVEYAVEKDKFQKLNQSRKSIDTSYLRTRIKVEIGNNEKGFPFIKFSRFEPKKQVIVPKTADDYVCKKVSVYEADKKMNVLKFAFEKILKLGNNAPENKMYQNVVVKK